MLSGFTDFIRGFGSRSAFETYYSNVGQDANVSPSFDEARKDFQKMWGHRTNMTSGTY